MRYSKRKGMTPPYCLKSPANQLKMGERVRTSLALSYLDPEGAHMHNY